MAAVLMPSVNSYFAIYTLMNPGASAHRRAAPNWDLHATAADRTMAISHARLLALQPGIDEVHVKQVVENLTSGLISVRNIKRWKRGQGSLIIRTGVYACLIACMAGLLGFLL